jgi:predicted ATP-grasp superfamily ATP-dependent carboligase
MPTPPARKPAQTASANAGARGALILGGAHGSLAVARSLGRRGIPVWFVTHDHPIAKYSRYTTQSFDWPGPDESGAAEWLVDFAARHRLDRWVLYPGGDAEARLIAQWHAALAEVFTLVTPPWSVARFACDKRLTHLHADSVGVDSPWSAFPADRREVAALDCQFPVILKPAFHAERNRFTMAKAWRVDDRATLLARYDEAASMVGRDAIMVQEWIPGGGEAQFSYAAVWDRGRPVASLVARRTRQFPVDFGFTSTYVETIEHREVEAQAFRFLADLRFSGMAEVEFKFDPRDGRTKLLDVNPRAWTWIGLGAMAGVDFPWIQWRLADGETVPRAHGQAGYAWAHASRDLIPAMRSIREGRLSFLGYARSLLRPMSFAAFAADDRWPAAVDLPIVAGRVVTRRLHLPRRWRRRAQFSRNRPAPSH